MLRRKSLFESTVIAGLALTALSTSAVLAQDTTQPPAAAEAEEDDDEEEIIITGSRIRASEFTAPSPVQVLTSEQADLRGLPDSARFLQSASVASGSAQVDSKISSAFVESGGPGAETISLRGLEAKRTLVLLNGKRAGPAGTRGSVSAVDLNVIPLSAIERIDILKDGASSIYGSDAIAGVVNIITKDKPNGGEIEGFSSMPMEEGGAEYRLNGTWGKTWDKFKFSASADYFKRNELKVKDRDFLQCAEAYIFDPVTGERKDLIDPFTGTYHCNNLPVGQLWLYDLDADDTNSFGESSPILLQYDATGQIGVFAPGTIFPAPGPGDLGHVLGPAGYANWFNVSRTGDLASAAVMRENHPFIQDSGIIPETERATFFVQTSFDFTPNLTAYGEILANRRETSLTGYTQFWDFQWTSDEGDYLSQFTGPWIISPTGIIDHGDSSQRVDYTRYVAGLKGNFGSFLDGWDWDIFYQDSRSLGKYTNERLLNEALDAQSRNLFSPYGGSCIGVTLPFSGRECLDFNFEDPDFLLGEWSQEARDLFLMTETGKTVYTQKTIEGVMTGDLLQLPAGPLGAALGFHLRRDEIRDVPGEMTLAGEVFSASTAGITEGDDEIKEVFAELNVPLLKDKKFFEDLNFSGSVRRTSVQTSGDATTYKAGLNWQFSPSIRFRATKGTSFRAPALFELYLAQETGSARLSSTDPCFDVQDRFDDGQITSELYNNCLDPLGPGGGVGPNLLGAGIDATIITSGGLGRLKPEESEAYTLGMVLTPAGSNLSIAIDYFDIKVSDEVTRPSGAAIAYLCYTSDIFPADPFCDLITRTGPAGDDANNIDTITADYINIADQRNRGVDVTVRYTHDIGPGALTATAQATYQIQDTTKLLDELPVTDTNGNVGEPKFTGNTELRYDWDDWTVQWSMQFVGPSNDNDYCIRTNDCFGSQGSPLSAFAPYEAVVSTDWVTYHDLSVRKRHDDWTFLAGVSNIFDTPPPRLTDQGFSAGNYVNIPATGGFGLSQYDLLGRRLFVNVSKSF